MTGTGGIRFARSQFASFPEWFVGYMSNVRLTKGSALYTSGFAVPSSPLSSVAGTSLLMKFANSNILDYSNSIDIVTLGNTAISTSNKKYTSSIYFDGTNCGMSATPTEKLNVGSTYTIECWIKLNALPVFGGQQFTIIHRAVPAVILRSSIYPLKYPPADPYQRPMVPPYETLKGY